MDDGRRKRKLPSKRRISPALSRIAERSLIATPEEVRTYQPTELDLKIAEAMLSGLVLFQEIAAEVGVSPPTVSTRLKDPVACAWISRAVHQSIQHRLGLVDAAMMQRAVTGNVQAARLLYDRFHQMVHRSEAVVHNVNHFDPSQLSDKELQQLVDAQAAKTAREVEFNADEAPKEARAPKEAE